MIETDEGIHVGSESTNVVLPVGDQLTLACERSPKVPGFYRVKCSFRLENENKPISESRIIGYQPEKIETTQTRQDDFDQFWKETLQQLTEVEPEFKLTPKPELSTDTHNVFEVSMRSLGDVRVKGWYERPKADGPHPALLRVPGYTQAMWPSGTSDAIAVFSFNIRGHGNSQQDISGAPADYWIRGLDDKHGYFYQGAYADCVRAVDFLVSRKEIDATRLAVTGNSQGGGLSLATAGLDPRICLCAPNIPFLCNWTRYFKTSSWPEMENWIQAQSHRSWDSTLCTMSYFDALNFSDKICCPIFLGMGLQDDVCPPVTIFAVYNNILGEKEFRIYPEAGHWVDAPHSQEQREWLMRHFAREE